MRLALLTAVVWLASSAANAAPRPTRGQVLSLLKQGRPAARITVSQVLDAGPAAPGAFVALFLVRGQDCYADSISPMPGARICGATSDPRLALIRPGPDGKTLVVEHLVVLPSYARPWANYEQELRWGAMRPVVMGGEPFIAIVYAYTGPMQRAVGATTYRQWTLVHLGKPPAIALTLVLDVKPEATTLDRITSRQSFRPAPGSAMPDVTMEQTISKYDPRAKDDERTITRRTERYRYQPATRAFTLVP